jgi:hypothetical protein
MLFRAGTRGSLLEATYRALFYVVEHKMGSWALIYARRSMMSRITIMDVTTDWSSKLVFIE